MRSSVIGTVVSGILVILLLVVTPLYYIGIVEWAKAENEVIADTRNLIDEVIDTRVLTDDMMADYNLSLAAKSNYYRATITREVKVVNPDPLNPGKTHTNYMVVDDITNWNKGDLITVKVEQVGTNYFRTISRAMLGLDIQSNDIQMTGRVR